MDKLIMIIVVILLSIGSVIYVYNTELGPGIVDGGNNLKEDIANATKPTKVSP